MTPIWTLCYCWMCRSFDVLSWTAFAALLHERGLSWDMESAFLLIKSARRGIQRGGAITGILFGSRAKAAKIAFKFRLLPTLQCVHWEQGRNSVVLDVLNNFSYTVVYAHMYFFYYAYDIHV